MVIGISAPPSLRSPVAPKQTRLRRSQVNDDGLSLERSRRNWISGPVQTATSSFEYIYYMLAMDVADSECIHAPKCITATVADRTSSVPEVPGTHGPATNRARYQRVREPFVRVWQVLHGESRSGCD